MVKYKYDAYGNVTAYGITDYDLAQNNPIRYRSYYYDEETGLYYLNARYYNPQWRRFISPDDTAYFDPESVNGLNLYAYCGNDPVNYADPSGCLAVTTLAIIIGATIGAGISAATSVFTQLEAANGDWGKLDWKKIGYDAFVGAINGALASSGINWGLSIALGAVMGFASSVGNDLIFNDGVVNWTGAFGSAVVGAISGLVSGAGANNVKAGMHITKFVNSKKVLQKTIANGTKRAISRQRQAMNVHAVELLRSGVKYLMSNTLSMLYTVVTN